MVVVGNKWRCFWNTSTQPPSIMRLTWLPTFPSSYLILSFVWFLFQFLCCCLEAFLSSDFFKLDILSNLQMSSFYRLWPCLIWSYGRQDIAFGREVTQCRKFCDTFLEKFISFNPWQILSSPFCERYLRQHTSIWFSWIAPIIAQLIQCFKQKWPQKQLFFYLKIVRHLIRVLNFY